MLFSIKSASAGPMGPAETAGTKGTAGLAGSAATTISMNAQNTAAPPLAIIIGRIAISLPNDQFLNCLTINAANTIFTFPVTGTHLITYHTKATDALLMFWHILQVNIPMVDTIDALAVAVSQFSRLELELNLISHVWHNATTSGPKI